MNVLNLTWSIDTGMTVVRNLYQPIMMRFTVCGPESTDKEKPESDKRQPSYTKMLDKFGKRIKGK